MSLTIPKPLIPIFTKPMTPPWVFALILATQLTINHIDNGEHPSCTLNVHYPHYSTSMDNRENIDSIKVNIDSECTAPQRFTEITTEITALAEGKVTKFSFQPIRQNADPTNVYAAFFKNLWKPCTKGNNTLYLASAYGYVRLTTGEEIKVSSTSGKYHPVKCQIAAK
jgi:hypothetical protein